MDCYSTNYLIRVNRVEEARLSVDLLAAPSTMMYGDRRTDSSLRLMVQQAIKSKRNVVLLSSKRYNGPLEWQLRNILFCQILVANDA